MNINKNHFKRVRKCKTERDAISAFLNDFKGSYGLTRSNVLVLQGAWEYADFFSNEVFLVKSVRDKISSKAGISDGGVRNSIVALSEKGFLKRIGQSHYSINSEYLPSKETIGNGNNFIVEINYEIA